MKNREEAKQTGSSKLWLRRLAGFEEASLDKHLRAHGPRLVARLAPVLIVGGLAFMIVPFFWGDAGNLQAGDWVAAGSVMVAAGGLFLTLARGAT
jgi:hypothetical protein